MKIKMNVTQELIDKGICQKIGLCALALAYNELIPDVTISYEYIAFYGRDKKLLTHIQPTAKQTAFMEIFDYYNKDVKPQTLEVEIPDSVIEYWYQSHAEAAAKIANSKILELV